MQKLLQALAKSPGIPMLLFVLGDIFMIPHGPGPLSWFLLILAAACALYYFSRNWYRLRR
jgi:hypothetical protein